MPLLVHRVVNLIALTIFCAILARLHEWSAAQAQASEREALSLLQVVSSRVGVGTILVEGELVRLANAAAEQMLGHASGSLNGNLWATVLPDHPEIDIQDPSTLRDFDVVDADEQQGTRRLNLRTDTVPGLRGKAVLVTLIDITERWQAEQQQQATQAAIARSLHEKEALIKEIHHRVKNNLQIVSSLLELQSAQLPNESSRQLLQESIHRVRSMALIHQHLYGMESLARIDEFITNAIKYGKRVEHPDGARIPDDCDVLIDIHLDGQQLVLGVADAGPGLPEGTDPAAANSLGLQLIRSLTRQIRGRVRFDSQGGARFELRCTVEN
jgi:two-component sensor histidine kinase